MTQATAIIVGASSHLSRELAKQLAEQQVELALFAQDVESLREFASTLPTKVQVFSLQIEHPSAIIEQLENVWQSLGG
ncbi:MAG: SDR family NAD(P)-dependent oxidoreductase, partial [Shewanella sp.]